MRSEGRSRRPSGRAEVVAIAAVARNGVIGHGSAIPWSLPADLARFRALTLGHVLIMGRRTYASIGRPLPGRTTLVLTRDADWHAAGVEVVPTLSVALRRASELDPAGPTYVAGGGEVYRAALADTDRLEITEVDAEPPGDAYFPAIDPADWTEVGRERHDGFAYVSYVRAGEGTRTLTP